MAHISAVTVSRLNITVVTKSRKMRGSVHNLRKGEEDNVYRVLVGKPEGKRKIGTRSRGEESMKKWR